MISDLCTADGREVDPQNLGSHGVDAICFSRLSKYNWPFQQQPPRGDFKFFRDMVRLCFCHGGTWRLLQPLGAWSLSEVDYQRAWDWFYSPSQKGLFRLELNGSFSKYSMVASRQRTRRFLSFSSLDALVILASAAPSDLQRVSVSSPSTDTLRMTNCKAKRTIPTVEDPPVDTIDRFFHFLDKAPESAYTASELETSLSIDSLMTDFRQGKLVAVSDGSYYSDVPIGAAEWILISSDDSEYILGGGVCPGSTDQLNAYRSELWGLLGISAAIWALEKTNGPVNDTVVVGCDGMAALTQSMMRYPESMTSKGKHFDLIAAIMGFWRNITATAVPTWVEGHVARRMRREDLPRLNQLNEDRDAGAKRIAQAGANSSQGSFFHKTC